MNPTAVLEQAQLFLTAAACLLVGCGALYLALGLYGMAVDRALRLFGVTAALISYITQNRRAWWNRTATWFERTFPSAKEPRP